MKSAKNKSKGELKAEEIISTITDTSKKIKKERKEKKPSIDNGVLQEAVALAAESKEKLTAKDIAKIKKKKPKHITTEKKTKEKSPSIKNKDLQEGGALAAEAKELTAKDIPKIKKKKAKRIKNEKEAKEKNPSIENGVLQEGVALAAESHELTAKDIAKIEKKKSKHIATEKKPKEKSPSIKNKDLQEGGALADEAKELTAKDIAKIERKKAKRIKIEKQAKVENLSIENGVLQEGVALAAESHELTAKDIAKIEKKKSKHIATEKKPKEKSLSAVNGVLVEAAASVAESKELTAIDIAKIEKKKVKKQAQKLRKQKKKLAAVAASSSERKESTKALTIDLPKISKPNVEHTLPASKDKLKTAKVKPTKHKGKIVDATKKKASDPAATVFVGNLPVTIKLNQLTRLFHPYGKVHQIRLRSAAGRKMFKHKQRKEAGSLNAYVVLDNEEMAAKSLALNGTIFKDNHLRVTPASKTTSKITTSAENDMNTFEADAKRTIFVGNLKYSANEEKLHDIFSSCGAIDYIRCLHGSEKGCNGVAYVCFKKAESVGLALELNETLLDDRPIHVERYSTKKLGAKKARDAAALPAKQEKSKKLLNAKGAKKRIDKRQSSQSSNGVKKKSEYRGVKVGGIKKSKKPKKKSNNQMVALAKKIAPKP